MKILILGDVGTGKTALTQRLIQEAALANNTSTVTVIDMAPERREFEGIKVGGGLENPLRPNVRILKPVQGLHAPRVEGHNSQEVRHFAKLNASIIDRLLNHYVQNPTPVLFVNDLSMHLQAGKPDLMMKSVLLSSTFVGNAYYGRSLENDQQSGVSQDERTGLDSLKTVMDRVLVLKSTQSYEFLEISSANRKRRV